MLCPECRHQPSGRIADHGAACYCKCHDVADAAPALLAACKAVLQWEASEESGLPQEQVTPEIAHRYMLVMRQVADAVALAVGE